MTSMRRASVVAGLAFVVNFAPACATAGGGGGGGLDGGGNAGGSGGFGNAGGSTGGFGAGGAGNFGGFGAGGSGNFGGFGAGGSGAFGATGGGGFGATGATGGFGATGATGGFGAGGSGGISTGGVGAGGGGATLPSGCADGVPINCNPVTNAGCTGSGEACDFSDPNTTGVSFDCYPPPNSVPKGGVCGTDPTNGPWCIPSYGCDTPQGTGGSTSGICRKYCCSASDCAAGETCAPFDTTLGTLGFCN